MRESEKGFTLVELSIVLVIIGLLIGGLLVAQSMITTAKIQALVKQEGQFDAAVENFQTKFQQLPGDTNLMGLALGNNNGVLTDDTSGSSNNNNSYFLGELAKFWSDLSQTGLTNPNGVAYKDYSNNNGSWTSNFNDYTPQAVMGYKANFIAIGSPASGKNYYLITQPTNITIQNAVNLGAFKPSEVLAVDSKIDDGLANSGNVSGWDNLGLFHSQIENATVNANNCTTAIAGSVYATSITSYTCSIRIRMGTSTGDLK